MVSFTFKSDTKADAIKILEKVKIFTFLESLANHSALITHTPITEYERKKLALLT